MCSNSVTAAVCAAELRALLARSYEKARSARDAFAFFGHPEHADMMDEVLAMLVAAANALPALLKERDAVRALLERVEWQGNWGGGSLCCSCCGQPKGAAHSADCELAALLGAAREGGNG